MIALLPADCFTASCNIVLLPAVVFPILPKITAMIAFLEIKRDWQWAIVYYAIYFLGYNAHKLQRLEMKFLLSELSDLSNTEIELRKTREEKFFSL